MNSISLKDINNARNRLKGVSRITPVLYSYCLKEISGADVYMKLENLQRTGSFKLRGAYNKLYSLTESDKKEVISKGVIAASAGNHAQGVSLAARLLGIKATIVMPEGTPITKVFTTKDYGAKVILKGKNFDEALQHAKDLESETGAIFIHPFDSPEVIAGQGTIGLEIIENSPELDAIFVPIGGGGLAAGISIAIKENNRNIKIIGVQAENAPSMFSSRKKGRIVETECSYTIADGIAVRKPGELTFQIIQKYIDDIITVNESEIAQAILFLIERERIITEGAGAVSLAGFLKKKDQLSGRKISLIVSGGNIDVNMLDKIIEKGLARSGRFIRLEIELPDTPGSLGKLADLFGEAKANILQISHNRLERNLPIDKAIIEVSLETTGYDHVKEILRLLKENSYNFKEKL